MYKTAVFESARHAATSDTDFCQVGGEEERGNHSAVKHDDFEPQAPNPVEETVVHVDAVQNMLALAGPRCPLCQCPINGVFFPVIQCEDCDRTYHQRCICFDSYSEYHPLQRSSIPATEQCKGCGCPTNRDIVAYLGYPGIMFHRLDQDPSFELYFQKGGLDEAKHQDLV